MSLEENLISTTRMILATEKVIETNFIQSSR
jgi:hypothetical protein